VLRPGVDPKREQQALLALGEGVAHLKKEDLASAEEALLRALTLWEKLAAHPSAPLTYRTNLVVALADLGWLRRQQKRTSDAEEFYARAVSAGEAVRAGQPLDEDFKQTVDDARAVLAELRGAKVSDELKEKHQLAGRKYEEGAVKARKGDRDAERLYREAIALREEILPQANEEYRRGTVAWLAAVYLDLAGLQQSLDERPATEASLKKAIEYGERAVAQDSSRPLLRHNLEVARRTLEELRAADFQKEINTLCEAGRFSEAVDRWTRNIRDQEEQLRRSDESAREIAVRRLAYRLDRLAWFLAHCPDAKVRDTKTAIQHAQRATELQPGAGDYWHTLALVQYRNGDWRDSLAALQNVKTREGGADARDWFVAAMDLYRLDRKEEARGALQKAKVWLRERNRQAEEDALMRFQLDEMRPAVDELRQEAESLIEGKDAA
jgi:tetratricopeptide (TPR) repeat protein